jgi:aerobic C4-dicarboxylate transport protein
MKMFTILKKSLFYQVIIALVLGVLMGIVVPEQAQQMKALGDVFIRLIQLLIAPIVFCVVVNGIAGVGNIKKVGRVGFKTILYFEMVTTLALGLGLLLGFNSSIGMGMNIDPNALNASAISAYAEKAQAISQSGLVAFLMNLVPTTVAGAFSKGDILQVLIFSILFACALNLASETAPLVVRFINELSAVLFKAMGIIVKLAPIGVFGAVAFTIGKYGVASLQQLGGLVVLYFITCILFVTVILGIIMKLCGLSLWKFLLYFREELTIVLGTTASDSVLPQIMRKLEHMGIKSSTVGLVIPTGYSFNLDGFSIYLTLGTIFIAHATNVPLALSDLLMIVIVSMITSKGAHGVPGSAIVILAATLSAIPAIPMMGLVLLLSVDWFIGIPRAVTNLIGNCVATVVIACWENDIDLERAKTVLAEGADEKIERVRDSERIA